MLLKGVTKTIDEGQTVGGVYLESIIATRLADDRQDKICRNQGQEQKKLFEGLVWPWMDISVVGHSVFYFSSWECRRKDPDNYSK